MKHFNAYSNFINEILVHSEFNNTLSDFTDFILYKKNIFIVTFEDLITPSKFKILSDLLNLETSLLSINPDSVDTFLETTIFSYNKDLITGQFYKNPYDPKLSNDIICTARNKFYNVLTNPLFISLVRTIKVNYFVINGQTYTKAQILKDQFKVAEYLYHGTSSENLSQILKEGVKPNPDGTIFKDALDNKLSHTDQVFVTPHKEVAYKYATLSTSKNFNLSTYPIIIEIDSSKLDPSKYYYDFVYYQMFVKKGKLSFDKLLEAKTFFPERFNQLSYEGIIRPSAINKVYYKPDRFSDKYEEISKS